jgi:transcriptional regulator GlxA family with amidase domain
VFVEPAFLPLVAKRALAAPVTGFPHDGLARAFDDLGEELAITDDVLPLFTEGWAMQALAYVARASRMPERRGAPVCGGLAPWQLRRAKEMLQATFSEDVSLQSVAEACRLSVSHFARAFKASAGVSPYQWSISARIERARDLLAHSVMPVVGIARTCGFADQSHFSGTFVRLVGTSPGAWRREHRD